MPAIRISTDPIGPVVFPMWQAQSKAELILRKAREQTSQYDVVKSLIQAIDELAREVRRIDNDIRRVRRDVNVKQRF